MRSFAFNVHNGSEKSADLSTKVFCVFCAASEALFSNDAAKTKMTG